MKKLVRFGTLGIAGLATTALVAFQANTALAGDHGDDAPQVHHPAQVDDDDAAEDAAEDAGEVRHEHHADRQDDRHGNRHGGRHADRRGHGDGTEVGDDNGGHGEHAEPGDDNGDD